MCGIAGLHLPNDHQYAESDIDLTIRVLLDEIEHRGHHATGIATFGPSGLHIDKAAVTARRFLDERSHANLAPADTRTVLLHTRWATQGSEKRNLNNHPVTNGRITVVHNGVISNDHQLFDEFGFVRHGEVDTEILAALLNHIDPFDRPDILARVRGSAAVAWIDAEDPNHGLWLSRVNNSPLLVAELAYGGCIFASTRRAVEAGADMLGARITTISDEANGSWQRWSHGICTGRGRINPSEATAQSTYIDFAAINRAA